MPPHKKELAEWGEAALRELRGPIAGEVRRKLARWRDPRARLLRQRKRAKQTAVTATAGTGVLAGGAYGTFAPHTLGLAVGQPLETTLDVAAFGVGGVAVATAFGAFSAWRRYRNLKKTPLPDAAPEPVQLPPNGSEAREPMRLLRDAEQSMHQSLSELSTAGFGDAAPDARDTANRAAAALRQVSGRLQAVEAALPHVPESEREQLNADVRRLRAELDEGVEGYQYLVAAAGRAVGASAAPEQRHAVQDATDRLAGLASALHELGRGSGASGGAEASHPN